MNNRSSHTALLYTPAQIKRAIENVAQQLREKLDLENDRFVAVCILEGALFFCADLTRCLPADLEIRSIQVSRFHGGTQGGEIEWVKKPNFDVRGKKILLIDEMCDEGISLAFVKEEFLKNGAAAVHTVVLVNKKMDRPQHMHPEFSGLTYDGNEFLGGYGLDLNRGARHINSIWTVPKEEANEIPQGYFNTQSPFFVSADETEDAPTTSIRSKL